MGLQCILHGRDSALCRINWQGLLGQDTELHIGLFLQFSRLPFGHKNAKVSKLCLNCSHLTLKHFKAYIYDLNCTKYRCQRKKKMKKAKLDL